MYHFFVKPENITEDQILIDGADVNHIKNVLRMHPGEEVLLSDGDGHDFTCSIAALDSDAVRCRILSREASGTEPSVKVYLFQGLPKADKFEHIIQKSVELGVYKIIPVETARCIVKYDPKKLSSKLERWQKISESAAKQSRRGIIPKVEQVMPLKAALQYASDLDMILIPYENYKDMTRTKEVIANIRPGMTVGIFIGPEGGFEQTEVEMVCQAGQPTENAASCFDQDAASNDFVPSSKLPADERISWESAKAFPISLGSRILRTETAPLMLLSVLMFNQEM